MKQSKKMLAMLLVLVMVFTMIPMTAFAANEPSISVSSAEAKPGEEVTLAVNIANRPDLMAMSFTVEYDETRLEKVSYTGSGMGGGTWDTSGKTLIWYNMSGNTEYPEGQILELKYTVKADAPAGDAEVKVTVKENYNWDEESFTFTENAGKVVVATTCAHSWIEATCSAPKKCELCGKTDGAVNSDAHSYVDGTCEYCGEEEPLCVSVLVNGEEIRLEDGLSKQYLFGIVPAGTDITLKYAQDPETLKLLNQSNNAAITYTEEVPGEYKIASAELKKYYNTYNKSLLNERYGVNLSNSNSDYLVFYIEDNMGLTPYPNGAWNLILEVLPLSHTWNEGEVTTQPTCTEKGVKTFICLVDGCGATKTEDVPANGHSYVDGYCSVCNKKEPTLIPFTKANHTDSGAAIHDNFTGVVGLEVDGVTLADWSEWVQGGNYQTQSITIYVAAEDKDKAVTFTLLLADGQTASGALINQTATVQLNSGVGSYSASRMVIGTGGMAPLLNLNITFKHELCEKHTWVDANCTTPKTCSVCAATEGDVRPHAYENGACKYEDCKTALPFTIKSGDTALIPVQIDAANCTKAGKDIYTFDLTVPEGTTSLDFSGSKFNLYNAETHNTLGSGKTSYSYSLSNGCITACYYDRTTKIYYHINILHVWNDATCTDPKTCANCGATEGEALGHTWGEGSICTVCGDANVITEIEVSHPSIEKNEETGVMTMAMVAGGSEKIDVSFGLVDAEVASTQNVAWFSSDTNVATVADGVVTALNAGTTTITAKAVDASGIALVADGEVVLAEFTLTVTEPTAGYTLTMGADVENAVIGSTVSVPVTIGHTDTAVTQYSAYDMSFTYDPAVLKLATFGTEITDVKDESGNSTGTIHVEHYGDKTDNGTALTLTFEAIATGETNVKVTAAKVDISESALTQDAPDASVIDDLTQVSVSGYTVTLPTEFTGASSILPGVDYTFTAKDKNYNYTVTAKIGDTEVTVTDNGDGTFTIEAEDISGNIVIETTKTGKTFNVTLGEDMTGAETAQYMAEGGYTATLTKAAGYNYSVEVTIGGVKFTNFTYDTATGAISIPAEKIIGDIVFNTNKTAVTQDKHNVTIGGNSGDVTGSQEVTNGENYTFTIAKEVGYKYTVTATMDGVEVAVIDNGDGTYTIENVTGDIEITVTKEYDLVVEVANYVSLNGKAMFLITATGSVDEGSVLAYNGTAMFYSNQYNAWSYLVITEETLSVDDAKALITLIQGEKVELAQTYDVNESTNVDINDAQLVFDMYNNEYQTFATATMQKFLKADVNGDKAVNVNDAAAIVADIIAAK